jgi:hypothetical protein
VLQRGEGAEQKNRRVHRVQECGGLRRQPRFAILLFWVLEDFLWFVLNPAFGLRRFRRDAIWWHAESWWGFMPRDYWIFTPIAVALFAASWLLR